MRALHGDVLLRAWESCHQQPEPMRALKLLSAANPDVASASLAELPLAERNRRLLELRTISFGTQLSGFALCEPCGAQMEFSLDARQIAAQMSPAEPLTWEEDGRRYQMRPVNTADLLACMKVQDGERARMLLLERAAWDGEGATESLLSEIEQSTAGWMERFDALNASAEVQLDLRCADCGAVSKMDLDIARFLGVEVNVAARRLLSEIHLLARAYGWGEQAITSMTATRRQAYLTMLDA